MSNCTKVVGCFSGKLDLRYVDGVVWRVRQNVEDPFFYTVYRYGCVAMHKQIRPADNMPTDLASVPRFFWRILPPAGSGGKHGAYAPAAVIHDILYRKGGSKTDRLFADRVFLEALRALGISKWRRRVMYRAVRALGWTSFGKDKLKKYYLAKEK